MGSNSEHGLRRTNQDKRKSVMKLLMDEEWSKWTANAIAKQCKVSHTMVNEIRNSLETSSSDNTQQRTYTNKYGKVSTMNTTNIGKARLDRLQEELGVISRNRSEIQVKRNAFPIYPYHSIFINFLSE